MASPVGSASFVSDTAAWRHSLTTVCKCFGLFSGIVVGRSRSEGRRFARGAADRSRESLVERNVS